MWNRFEELIDDNSISNDNRCIDKICCSILLEEVIIKHKSQFKKAIKENYSYKYMHSKGKIENELLKEFLSKLLISTVLTNYNKAFD